MTDERPAIEMINACFRRQHPEAFGDPDVPDAIVPTELRYGRDEILHTPAPTIPEEAMGDPHALPLDAPVIILAGTYP